MSYEAQDLIIRFLMHDPEERSGASGSAEVKAHPFFRGVNWDSLALQKAAFVPQPDSGDDMSYFISWFNQMSSGMPDDQNCSNSDSGTQESYSNSGVEVPYYLNEATGWGLEISSLKKQLRLPSPKAS
ncbi:hypothetical protein ACB098_03G017400 [Castanea mollissima]